MKPSKQTNSSSTLKDVEAYFSSVPEPARSTLLAVRAAIRSAAPKDAFEGFSYGFPAFKVQDGTIGGCAARAGFCSYYPMSGRVITRLKAELKDYQTSSGAIRFPVDKPLPDSLVKKLVKARMEEIEKDK